MDSDQVHNPAMSDTDETSPDYELIWPRFSLAFLTRYGQGH